MTKQEVENAKRIYDNVLYPYNSDVYKYELNKREFICRQIYLGHLNIII